MCRNLILIAVSLGLFCALLAGPKLSATDLSEIDADVEESMADSDAAKVEAHRARERLVRENDETDRARRVAEKAKQAAEAKRNLAHDELQKMEKQIQANKRDQTAMKKEVKTQEAEMAKSQAKIKAGMVQLEKSRLDLQTLQDLKAENLAKIAELDKQQQLSVQNAAAMDLQLTHAKAEFIKSGDDAKAKALELEKTKADQVKKSNDTMAQIEVLKGRHREAQEKTVLAENDITKQRQKLDKLEEEAKIAESEVRQSDARLQDAQERLKDLNAGLAAKENNLNQRKVSATDKLQSRARQAQEASLAIDQATAGQALSRKLAEGDTTPMAVDLQNKASNTAQRFTFSRDCQVFAGPSDKAKVLGTKRAGTSVNRGQTVDDWISFSIRDGRTVFVAKNCF